MAGRIELNNNGESTHVERLFGWSCGTLYRFTTEFHPLLTLVRLIRHGVVVLFTMTQPIDCVLPGVTTAIQCVIDILFMCFTVLRLIVLVGVSLCLDSG